MSINKLWSKSKPFKPKDNLTTEAGIRSMQCAPIAEPEFGPVSMAMIIGMEYARIWQREREVTQKEHQKKSKAKRIANDFQWWLKLRKTNKRFCKIN